MLRVSNLNPAQVRVRILVFFRIGDDDGYTILQERYIKKCRYFMCYTHKKEVIVILLVTDND